MAVCQIAGALIGFEQTPVSLVQNLEEVPDYGWIGKAVEQASLLLNDRS